MMNKIAIYGAGGFGCEVACLIEKINQRQPQWELVGFYDDKLPAGTTTALGTVLGGIDALNSAEGPLGIVLAVRTPATLKAMRERITNPDVYFPNIIDPDVEILHPSTVHFGQGNIVATKCVFTIQSTIGDFNIFNTAVGTGHDNCIGNYNVFMQGVRISGDVHIGDENFFGMLSGAIQGVKIGNNTSFEPGSMVIRNTRDGLVYSGNPARKTKI